MLEVHTRVEPSPQLIAMRRFKTAASQIRNNVYFSLLGYLLLHYNDRNPAGNRLAYQLVQPNSPQENSNLQIVIKYPTQTNNNSYRPACFDRIRNDTGIVSETINSTIQTATSYIDFMMRRFSQFEESAEMKLQLQQLLQTPEGQVVQNILNMTREQFFANAVEEYVYLNMQYNWYYRVNQLDRTATIFITK